MATHGRPFVQHLSCGAAGLLTLSLLLAMLQVSPVHAVPLRSADVIPQHGSSSLPSQTATFQGHVRDLSGNPISGALVHVTGTALTATSDSAGWYSIRDAPAGIVSLVATHGLYDTRSASLRVAAGATTTVSFRLPHRGSITGSVIVESTGRPVPGAAVHLVDTSLTVSTNAQGQYRLPAVQAGHHHMTVSASGYAPVSAGIIARSGRTVRSSFSLTPSTGSSVKLVVSPGSTTPSSTVSVTGLQLSSNASGRLTLDGYSVGTFKADSTGTFAASISLPANLAPGTHTLRATDSRITTEATIQVQSPESTVTVTVDRDTPIGVSRLATGVSHTLHSADSWNDPESISVAKSLLASSTAFQNQHIVGWGVDDPWPDPSTPQPTNWGSIDGRMSLIRGSGGTPVIQLFSAPWWMKNNPSHPRYTRADEWSILEQKPDPAHYQDFAKLAVATAKRYPDVRYFIIWNEMAGFYRSDLGGPGGRWDYEEYTRMYNVVYDALKAYNPNIQVGGPYVILTSGNASTMSDPTAIPQLRNQPYGTIDQRALDVITYWLAHKHGADFIALDGSAADYMPGGLIAATKKFADVDNWVRTQTSLPIWWTEWYCTGWPSSYSSDLQNACMATSLVNMITSGASVELKFQPQGERDLTRGNQESIWSDTRTSGGGMPFPFFYTARAIHERFAPGTVLYRTTSSSRDIVALASADAILLINTRPTTRMVNVEGSVVMLPGYEVYLLQP